MSGTELSLVNQFPVLIEGGDAAEAMAANLQCGESVSPFDLPRIKVPASGGTTWIWESVSGEQTAKSISGVLVVVQPHSSLWPSEQTGQGAVPYLVSHDMVKGYKVGEDWGDLDPAAIEKCRNADGSYDWQSLPYNKFGSTGKPGSNAKRIKDSRDLYILMPGEVWPVVVSVPPTSLKRVSGFIKQLRVPHYRAVISLSLARKEGGAGVPDYSEIVPKLDGELPRESGEQLRNLYTDPIKAALARSLKEKAMAE